MSDVNMYGITPCPDCGSKYRWPTRENHPDHPNSVLCDDCGRVESSVDRPGPHCNPLFPGDPSMCWGDDSTCECVREETMEESVTHWITKSAAECYEIAKWAGNATRLMRWGDTFVRVKVELDRPATDQETRKEPQ